MSLYPDHPGHKGGDTSKAAADAIAPHLNRLQGVALAAIRAAGDRGLTKEELAETTGLPEKSIGPRAPELARKGLVKDSGQRRLNDTGKPAKVWVAVSGAAQAISRPKSAPNESPDTTQCEAT